MFSRILFLLMPWVAAQTTFTAGVARIDLAPPKGIPMSGYSIRYSKGQHDPIEARILALSDGKRRVALVTLDLCFPFEPPAMDEIRAQSKVDEVIFHASHTHSGPTYMAAPEALKAAIPRVVTAINDAAAHMTPAKIGSGWGQTYIGFNRRYIRPGGAVHMFWRNEPKSTSTFPVDPTVGVIRVDRAADGTPLAILVHYACHPVIFGPDNLDYSADFPYEMRLGVEEAMPGSMAFFLQGAPGDINPYFDKTPLIEDAEAVMRATGRQLAAEAVRVARVTQTRPITTIRSKTVIVPSRNRWNLEKLKAVAEERYHLDPLRSARLLRDDMQLPVTTLLLDDAIAIAGMPGEPFVEFQMQFRAKSPIPASFLLGYTNGYFAYFPTIAAAARGGYGASTTVNPTEVGIGEAMLNTALISIYELLGKLKPEVAVP
jgi:neutral ceramidase